MVTRLNLSNGQWLDVKDRLKVKDKRDQHSYSVDGVSSDGQTYRFNIVKHGIATAAIRIVNWLVNDETGKPVAWPSGKPFKDRVEAIESLDEEVFEEIAREIRLHVERVEEASDAAKKSTPDGETNSATTSPSVN